MLMYLQRPFGREQPVGTTDNDKARHLHCGKCVGQVGADHAHRHRFVPPRIVAQETAGVFVIAGVLWLIGEGEVDGGRHQRLHAVTPDQLDARIELIRRDGMKALVPAAIDLAFADQPKDARYHEYTRRFLRNDPWGYETMAMGMVGADLTDALTTMKVPGLVVVGRSDRLFPPERALEVHQHLKGSRFVVLEDAAHFPPYQTPMAFVDVVSDFFDHTGRSYRLWQLFSEQAP